MIKITHVDAVLITYLRACFSNPGAVLAAVVKELQGNSPFWIRESGKDLFQGQETVEQLTVENGILTGKITDEEASPAFVWEKGKLYIWKSGIILPLVVMEASSGKKLRQLASHRWIPDDVLIEQTTVSDLWYCVEAANWNKPLKQAIEDLR